MLSQLYAGDVKSNKFAAELLASGAPPEETEVNNKPSFLQLVTEHRICKPKKAEPEQ